MGEQVGQCAAAYGVGPVRSTPVDIAAAVKVPPTTRQNTSSATEFVTSGHADVLDEPLPGDRVLVAVEGRGAQQHGDHGDEAGARNHRRQVGQRAAHHQPVAVAAPDGELGEQAEYTSNGSARSSHSSPKIAAPTSMMARYAASQIRTEPR